MNKISFTIKVDHRSVRKRAVPVGGAMKPKRGRGAYRRKNKNNSQWEE